MNHVSPNELTRLAKKHITRFENLLRQHAQGAPGIRASECLHYLAIWRCVFDKRSWEALTPEERGEVLDAVESGE